MKINMIPRFSKLFLGAAVIAMVATFTSCGDDEKIDCSKLEEKAIEASFEALEAISNDDCEGIEDAFAESVKILKQGKSCDFVQDLMDEYEVDSIEELEAEFNSQRDEYLAASDCD